MKKALFDILPYYRRLKSENKIRETGYHFNRSTDSIDYDFDVNSVLITVKNFQDRTEIMCYCKKHIFKNATCPQIVCKTKLCLQRYLVDTQ